MCGGVCVCAFSDMQSPRIGLIMVLEVGVGGLYSIKSGLSAFLGQLLYNLTFYFSIFVLKCKIENKKGKKKPTLIFRYFRLEKGKQTSFF